ncbi:hypothetical protein GCM10022631_29940 [Deinococcus rubellus]
MGVILFFQIDGHDLKVAAQRLKQSVGPRLRVVLKPFPDDFREIQAARRQGRHVLD